MFNFLRSNHQNEWNPKESWIFPDGLVQWLFFTGLEGSTTSWDFYESVVVVDRRTVRSGGM